MTAAYVDVAGHPTWVKELGVAAGPAVVLLHGGLSHCDDLDGVIGPLLADHRIVAFDRRGHGRTADRGGRFHYDDMAADTIAVLEQVVGGAADLIGWSDG